MKIPFDISKRPQIESGEYKVVTGDDRPVKIICWDKKVYGGRFEIVGLVPTPQGDTDTVQLYCPDGTLVAASWNEKFKLFIITPKPELSEFEERLRIICENAVKEAYLSPYCTSEDFAKKHSAELLALARKELVEEQYTSDPRKTGLYKLGKAEALKDLPMWKKADRDFISNTIDFAVPYTHDGGDHDDWVEVIVTNIVHKGEDYLEISDLEKLPGFNK